jgi:Ala-tRNA(Pro) deacylase
MRSADYLSQMRIAFDSLPHAPAFSASRCAHWLHLAGREVSRAVLLTSSHSHFLAVLRSTHEIDLDALACCLCSPLRLASPEEMARIFPDCEPGSVSSFGNLYGVPVILDCGIDPDEDIVFAIGSHVADVRLTCQDYERLTGALRLDFARPIKMRSAGA